MDDEIETLMIGVRADTQAFATDAARMRDTLSSSLGSGADQGSNAIERSLAKAIASGKLGFDDLKDAALTALSQIATQSITSGLSSLFGAAGGGGQFGAATNLVGGVFGLPGRATGGPVSPGAAYLVGERGPELFVPTSAGSIAAPAASAPRAVNVSIAITAPQGTEPLALARSSRQIARSVSAALAQAER